MRYEFFEIKNFRGIRSLRLDFTQSPHSNVYTFVGLNESGKTTVLEAINHFSFPSESLAPLGFECYGETNLDQLIPISLRANFSENIEIRVGVSLDDDDHEQLKSVAKIVSDNGSAIAPETIEIKDLATFVETYHFENSTYQPDKTTRTADVIGPLTFENDDGREKHTAAVKRIHAEAVKLLPRIIYFPNFLFEFPSSIALGKSDAPGSQTTPPPQSQAEKKDDFYKTVVQDILDALGISATIQMHILNRFGNPSEKNALDDLLLKMERDVSSRVFTQWNQIFGSTTPQKRIRIEIDRDATTQIIHLKFRVEDPDGFCEIKDKSLGFRWFFVFCLLTHYRGFRKTDNKRLLFLLDEPASNLHSTAQQQLLSSFESLSEQCDIIYSTHSHHLINPNWLENTYVIRNEALDIGKNEEDFSAQHTNISATRYRKFVGSHPDKATYFQPVLDVLAYHPSPLETIPNVVMTEGKNDFYSLSYFAFVLNHQPIRFMPGGGAGSLTANIRNYIAWGRQFIVLLDGDEAGEREGDRYKKLFGRIVEDRIFTLSDIDPTWHGKACEDLLTPTDRDAVIAACSESVSYDKKLFNRCVQELFMKKERLVFEPATNDNLHRVLVFLREQLARQTD